MGAALGQSWNGPAVRALGRVAARPGLLAPHFSVGTVGEVDFPKLRAAGVRAVLFDKDNTLTRPYELELHPAAADGLRAAVAAFGADRVAVLSNSAGGPDDSS